jgi:hypothetical protein
MLSANLKQYRIQQIYYFKMCIFAINSKKQIPMSQISPHFKKNIDALIAAIIGFVLVILYTQYGGIGISPDSIAYTCASRSFVTTGNFTDVIGLPLVAFPLFYPFFLSLVMFISRTDIITIAPYLNGLLFAAVIFISGIIIENFKYKTNLYKRILLTIITFSPSLIEIYTMLWSETLFILLILVFILFFHRYFRSHNIITLVAAAIVAALAFDTRYAGITLVATGCLLIFFDKNLGWKKKAEHTLLFGSIGISLVALNLVRNILENGLATGMRQKGVTPLTKNIEFSGGVLSDWFTIQFKEQLFFEILAIAIMILFIIFFIKNIRHWKSYYTYENTSVAFFIVYVLFIIISSTISRYETINNRLLAPAFLPALWISTCQIPKWRAKLPHQKLRWIFFAFSVGIATVVVGSYFAINKENLSYMRETGIPGYTEDTWTKSHIVNYLQKNDEYFDRDSTVYSNHSQAVYFLTNHSVFSLPERVYTHDVKEFKAESPIVLIWFYNDPNPDLLTMKEIRHYKKVERVKAFSDGAIYILKNVDN